MLDGYRGRGLGKEVLREAVENGPRARLNWTPAAEDAHRLYRRFGFSAPNERFMQRRADR